MTQPQKPSTPPTPPSPRLPEGAAQPPYTPGGVPEPEGHERAKGKPENTLPPRQRP
jgi:hypothetical protein